MRPKGQGNGRDGGIPRAASDTSRCRSRGSFIFWVGESGLCRLQFKPFLALAHASRPVGNIRGGSAGVRLSPLLTDVDWSVPGPRVVARGVYDLTLPTR